jgi:hypothetical protein
LLRSFTSATSAFASAASLAFGVSIGSLKQKAFSVEALQSALPGKICTDDFFALVEREIAANATCSEATRRALRLKIKCDHLKCLPFLEEQQSRKLRQRAKFIFFAKNGAGYCTIQKTDIPLPELKFTA